MTVSATLGGVFLKGTAAARPAANAVAGGTVYSATDTGVITQSDGASWSTWATISSGMADPMTTRGDTIVRNASNVTARLGIGAAGTVLSSDGTDVSWAAAAGGAVLDYVEKTGSTNITSTSSASGDTVLSGTSQAYAAGAVWVETFFPRCRTFANAGAILYVSLYDGSTELGVLGEVLTPAAAATGCAFYAKRKLTLSAATHQLVIKASTNGGGGGPAIIAGGAGGTGTTFLPGFIRVTAA